MEGSANHYLQMYLSEQIPESEWQRILQTRNDVKQLYEEYVRRYRNDKTT